MQDSDHQSKLLPAAVLTQNLESFPPLSQLSRTHITTEEAAFFINRAPQTLRSWACYENGPIRAVRIHGRLNWSVAEIKALLEGGF